jgi:cytochrome c553
MEKSHGTHGAWRYAACLVFVGAPVIAVAQQAADGGAIAAKGTAGGATACVACHGVGGEGNPAAGFPRLAGLPQAYLVGQLGNFAAGKRQNPVMSPIAKQLSAAEQKAVAAYYGAMAGPPITRKQDDNPERTDTGAWLAVRGRWEDNLPACLQCHGPGGGGVGSAFPALAGQSSAYIAAQLHAFKDGTRPGGPLDLMKAVAAKLSDADIDAVSNHFGSAVASAGGPAKEAK